MKIRFVRFVVAPIVLAALVGCAKPAPPPPAPVSGVDKTLSDATVRPQDDLFRHVNGGWLAKTEIPADRSIYGAFVQLIDQSEADVRALIEEVAGQPNKPAGSAAQQIGDLFASFVDEATINKLGAEPLKTRLAEIDAIENTTELATTIGKLSNIGVAGPVNGGVEADAGDPTKVALYLSQSGTALPDRDYYLSKDAHLADARAKYQQYLETVFTLAGRPNAAATAKSVLALETSFARIQWPREDTRDAVKTYNKYAVTKLIADAPGFDWMAWGRAQKIDATPEWIIEEPSFFKAFAKMVPTTSLDTWKAWLAAKVITLQAPLLSQPFQDAHFEFFNKTLSGQKEPRLRWKRGVQLVNNEIGEAVGQLYVAKHFPASSKERMQGLIANLIEAYRQSISELDWMTPETKKQALAKLAKFSSKIGYPNKWRDYSALKIVAGDLIGNVERANLLETEHEIGKLGKPVDREEWLMTPQTVNAYYNEVKNEIVFPAAILQPPFFNPSADDAVNYGGIGAVIGHEIGHGFDDQGRKYDGDGKLRDWWTSTDAAEFEKRTKMLIAQFNAYSPLPGLHVNGVATQGENIGDLGGLSIAYRAWKISLQGKTSPTIDGLSGDERYFMGWGQVWRAKARDQYLQRQVLADPHSWSEFRANGPVSNFTPFYDTFGLKPGDKLFRAPDERVKIW